MQDTHFIRWQDDYMYDACGNAVPIRWLAPECVELSGNAAVSLRSITKECNLWSVQWLDYTLHAHRTC